MGARKTLTMCRNNIIGAWNGMFQPDFLGLGIPSEMENALIVWMRFKWR